MGSFGKLRWEREGVEWPGNGVQFANEFEHETAALPAGCRRLLQIAGKSCIAPSMLRNGSNRSEGRNTGSAQYPIPAPPPSSVTDPAMEILRLRENDGPRLKGNI